MSTLRDGWPVGEPAVAVYGVVGRGTADEACCLPRRRLPLRLAVCAESETPLSSGDADPGANVMSCSEGEPWLVTLKS